MQYYMLMYLLAPFLFDIITHLDAKKCYVCGPKSYEPFRSLKNAEKTTNQNNKQIVTDIKATKTLINTDEEDDESLYTKSCDILEKYIQNQDIKLMNEFVKECPPNYLGCLTQKDVNQTTRTCEFVAFNDCHPANGVTYCYCSEDLCNDKLTLPTEPDKPKINYQNDRNNNNNNNRYSDENSDDEDISDEESSGMGEKLKTFTSKTNNKGTSNGNNHSTKLFTINSFQINFIIVISFKFFIKFF